MMSENAAKIEKADVRPVVRPVVRPLGHKNKKKKLSSVGSNPNAMPSSWKMDPLMTDELRNDDSIDAGTLALLEMNLFSGNKCATWFEFIAKQMLRMNQELLELKAAIKVGDCSKLWLDHKPQLIAAFKHEWYVNFDVLSISYMYAYHLYVVRTGC
jgi:hypothetical protein